MNGISLDTTTLQENINFIREEIKRIKAIKKNVESCPGARSDDAARLIITYDSIISNLNYLLQYNYDAENI